MTLPNRGILIAVEGIDGAGKTTQVAELRAVLERAGLEVVTTKEPTDRTPHGRRIRASAASERLPLADELHAFLEDRRAHVATLIEPALAAGKIVLVDRYYFSSVAYQGARGASTERILELNEAFAPRPDLLVILEVDPTVGLARVRRRGAVSTFELEDELERAAFIFSAVAGADVLRVDGRLPVEEVTHRIVERVTLGPLRAALCGGEADCDPVWCVAASHGGCAWPTLAGKMRVYGEADLGAVRAAISAAATPSAAIEAIVDLARRSS